MTPAKTPPVVVLCGFMGTGKTAIGRELAVMLGVPFIDTDAEIEARTGTTIARLFDKRGESAFRDLESDLCRSLDPEGGAVIASGGGMIMDRRNFLHLQSLGTTVLLEASVEAIVARTGGASDRPLLRARDGESDSPEALHRRVSSLLDARMTVYSQCELHLDTTHRTPVEGAYDVAEMLRVRAQGRGELVPIRVDTRTAPARVAGRVPDPGSERLSRVVVGRGVVDTLGEWLARLELTTGVHLFTPPAVDALHGKRVRAALDARSIPCHTHTVDDGDAHKTLAQAAILIDALIDDGVARDHAVVTLGGGVTGDVAGFVAAVTMRGLPLVHVPTTLLAQVDAAIGGKTGVNHARAKNLIGAIHQPVLVLSDVELLATLPDREIAGGMAEVVKTAIIGSENLFDRLVVVAHDGGDPRDPDFLAECVAACARVKGRIVEADPVERDLRRVLNLGHTLGHALEAAGGYASLTHGEAVGLGLLAAWRVAVARGAADAAHLEATRRILAWCGLPTEVPAGMERPRVRAALGLDKKRLEGRLTFVLPRRPGAVDIVGDVAEDELMAAMDERKEP